MGPKAAGEALKEAVTAGLSDDALKALNLLHDWLRTLLPHVLAKARPRARGRARASWVASRPAAPSPRRPGPRRQADSPAAPSAPRGADGPRDVRPADRR